MAPHSFLQPDLRNGFSLPAHLTMANFTGHGGEHSSGTNEKGQKGSGLASYVASLIDRWDYFCRRVYQNWFQSL